MLQKTKQYLEKTLSKNGKYLLALSGGPDSIALFHLLLEAGCAFDICHVDHGWRVESGEEAIKLAEIAKKYGICFHLYKIDPNELKESNLEDFCRQKRLWFFKEVYETGDFDALFMGHHADDQVETILKRIFEGSSLPHLFGMKEETVIHGMRVLRPLLSQSKSDIIDYLKFNRIDFFEDSTNNDPRYLRNRMRKEMVPYLEDVFGKNVRENILLLGKRIEECMHYVQNQVNAKSAHVYSGPFGYYLQRDLLHKEVEGEALLREIFKKEKIMISRGEIAQLLQLVNNHNGQKGIVKSGWKVIFEREHLFILKTPQIPQFEISNLPSYRSPDDWRGIWKGSSAVFFPDEQCVLGPPKLNYKLANGMELKEWYRIHKVPVFFRSLIPVIWRQDQIVGECLTGKSFLTGKPLYANHLLTLK